MTPAIGLTEVIAAIEREGLLLVADARLPSVGGLVAGGPVSGSWWGHSLGHTIFALTLELADHPDVLEVKLLSGKVTYVHRRLWSPLLAIATARRGWQTDRLSADARRLLRSVDAKGELRTDAQTTGRAFGRSLGDAARELERRLLVHSESVHTERGAHAKRLETWAHWAAGAGFKPERLKVETAMQTFDGIVAQLNARFTARGALPWPPAGAARSSSS